MKKLFAIAATVLFSANTFALSTDYKFVQVNESVATNVCYVAATEGVRVAKNQARRQAGFTDIEFNATKCNGMNIRRFAAKYANTEVTQVEINEKGQVEFVFKPVDNSFATKICKVAAEQGLNQALEQGGKAARTVYCNGEKIVRFARRYSKV